MTSQIEHENGNSATTPTPKLEEDFYDWYARHRAKCQEAESGDHCLVFIGDSITHLFEGDPHIPGRGERVWAEFYAPRRAFNLGFGWDRTQNVLWRLAHGEFAGQAPRLVVILIGTNNLTGTSNARTNTSFEIAEGIRAICDKVSAASPESRILLMGILPRDAANSPLRARIREVNTLLKAAAERHPAIRFLDIGSLFLPADGTISKDIMSDGVHLTERGYRIWAEAIEPIIRSTLGSR